MVITTPDGRLTKPHIMLFDLLVGGHHGQYIRQLVEYWGTSRLPGQLTVAAPEAFFGQHKDVVAATARSGAACMQITGPIDMNGPLAMMRDHGHHLKQCVHTVRPTHVMCMYCDQGQLSLALGLRFSRQIALSGIYVRPTFHYKSLGTLQDRVARARKRLMLRAALSNPYLKTLFCLDPYVIPHVGQKLAQLVPLPDGVPATSSPVPLQWDIESGRRLALFFGSIAERKGIFQLLDALPMLSDAHQKQLALLIVGKVQAKVAARLRRGVAHCRSTTQVHIHYEFRFVDEGEIHRFFERTVLALLP